MVAAATTSLPETPGRRAQLGLPLLAGSATRTFALWGLYTLGFDWEANDFFYFIADVAEADAELQIMYGVDGRARADRGDRSTTSTGYEGARPVRIGNGAYNQHQHDVWGAVLDSVYLHTKSRDQLAERIWPILARQVEAAIAHWREPDRGIWEVRGEPKHFTLVEDHVLGRAATAARGWPSCARTRARRRAGRRPPTRSTPTSARNGVDERGVFTQHYDTDGARRVAAADAAACASCPPTTRGSARPSLAIADELTDDGLVLRYRVEETDDGLTGEEGTFTICSFWLVSRAGRDRRDRRARRELCEKLLELREPARPLRGGDRPALGRHLGNFPQAFTHLALINAVMHVIHADQELVQNATPPGARPPHERRPTL